MQTPQDNFENDVAPACEAYFADATSTWKAKSAAQALNNFVEWTFHYYAVKDPARLMGTKHPQAFREYHASACPVFRIVWDLADAAKHRHLNRKASLRIVTSSTGAWAETENTLVIKSTGDELDVAIGMAMDYWKKLL